MRGENLGANLPLFWNNDGKDRPKGQICPLAKKVVFPSNAFRCVFATIHKQLQQKQKMAIVRAR